MALFTQFLKQKQPVPVVTNSLADFERSWASVESTLEHPDERQLIRGIAATHVPDQLESLAQQLISEARRSSEATAGPCLEYLLKHDILGSLVSLSETDRPFGIQAEVLKLVITLTSNLDEQFLVHSVVHKAIIRLLKICVGDEVVESLDGAKILGAAGTAIASNPSEYEFELVDLLGTLCTRIRTYPELLLIFLHDKHWVLPPKRVRFKDEEAQLSELGTPSPARGASPLPSGSAPSRPSSRAHRNHFEFLIFNYLLRFVHREGNIGVLARGGILSLINVAMTAGESSERAEQMSKQTGMDPVTEAAVALAEYILEGDFADVLCAGLGAVYSELPSKLRIRTDSSTSDAGGMSLGALTEDEKLREDRELDTLATYHGLVLSDDHYFKARIDHFLKILEFIQDVMIRLSDQSLDRVHGSLAPSAFLGSSIVEAILDAFRFAFLQNILYPSILECSDADGSSVAVMTYIDEMLHSITEVSLADLVVVYLLNEDDETANSKPLTRSNSFDKKAKKKKKDRRKSTAMVLLEAERKKTDATDYFTSLGRFTLKDLLISNSQSPNSDAATSALRLLHSLFSDHCHLSIDGLISAASQMDATSFSPPDNLTGLLAGLNRDDESEDDELFTYPGALEAFSPKAKLAIAKGRSAVGRHEREINAYLNLASSIVSEAHEVGKPPAGPSLSTSFSFYLQDAATLIQHQSCFVSDPADVHWMRQHRMLPSDPLVNGILDSLRLFFSHTPEENVALTSVLTVISACPHRSISGWLTRSPAAPQEASWPADAFDHDAPSGDVGNDADDRINFLDEDANSPVVLVIIMGLAEQLDRYRELIPDFDRLLSERRDGLLFTENMSEALSLHMEMNSDHALYNQARRALFDSQPPPAPPNNTPAKAASAASKAIGALSSGVSSLFTPTKSTPSKSQPSTPQRQPPRTPVRQSRRSPSDASSSPFAPHYKETSSVEVPPFVAPSPSVGPWSPASKQAKDRRMDSFRDREYDVFADQAGFDDKQLEKANVELRAAAHVSLSRLLDNVVILQEALKELAAIIHVRRSMGIDALAPT